MYANRTATTIHGDALHARHAQRPTASATPSPRGFGGVGSRPRSEPGPPSSGRAGGMSDGPGDDDGGSGRAFFGPASATGGDGCCLPPPAAGGIVSFFAVFVVGAKRGGVADDADDGCGSGSIFLLPLLPPAGAGPPGVASRGGESDFLAPASGTAFGGDDLVALEVPGAHPPPAAIVVTVVVVGSARALVAERSLGIPGDFGAPLGDSLVMFAAAAGLLSPGCGNGRAADGPFPARPLPGSGREGLLVSALSHGIAVDVVVACRSSGRSGCGPRSGDDIGGVAADANGGRGGVAVFSSSSSSVPNSSGADRRGDGCGR
mmetsp:Transcript_15151/g.46985  ORF Transcript_15151/g.46985 Transcript_15151/m.46985 type:complete len:319 (-) Transcript_15151:797-1753(-)